MKIVITLPSDVAWDNYAVVTALQALMDYCGGVTITTGSGSWKDAEGRVAAEPVELFAFCINAVCGPAYSELCSKRDVVVRAALNAGEQAVLVETYSANYTFKIFTLEDFQ